MGFVALFFFTPAPAGSLLASTVWDSSWGWALTALPLFIWMGEILFRSRLSEDMFKGLAPWLGWLPGRLLHVNILGCGVMAAVSGSSSVTCATIGRMSMPELRKRGYHEGMAIGTLAGSGTLGLLIPPSIMMIVYGITAQVSIGRLFIAGFLPGFMMIGLFMAYTAAWSVLNPTKIPADDLKMSLGREALERAPADPRHPADRRRARLDLRRHRHPDRSGGDGRGRRTRPGGCVRFAVAGRHSARACSELSGPAA